MRRVTALQAWGLVVGALFVLAPVGVTPKGCGDLSGGRLCLSGPIGGTGEFAIRYVREAALPAIPVRLGYQRRDERLTAYPGWFGTVRTRHGSAELTSRLVTLPGECVRGVMEHRGRVYATPWACSR